MYTAWPLFASVRYYDYYIAPAANQREKTILGMGHAYIISTYKS